MNQWVLWITGLVLCAAALLSLGLGFAADRGTRAAAGIAGFLVLWCSGFFCFVGAS
ncbi:hypothetical protein [Lentzea cavernae]|uniref:Uncharacterized protein n=1 Tax=Lentzea cavernae TaxID=2020703 RepID=A0ABQ3N0Z9_9PSEU|nr:hypothetical protein [Lentzea cavernae]GHH57768.1 hypothetical protein GCM10017774_77990 [Lentzea cavernae]